MRILYMDIDSLRPDHLGVYGYHRDASPNIDKIAAEGRRFTGCYVSDAPCLPSRTALFSGRFGVHTGVVNHGGHNAEMRRGRTERGFRRAARFTSLASALRDTGLHTASVSPFPHRHDAWHVLEGFEEYYDTGKNGTERADEVYPVAAEWLEDNAREDDWFLHVNFWDPHTPYETPAAFGNPFEDDPAPEWVTKAVIDDHRSLYGPHSATVPHSKGDDWGGARDLPRMPEEIATVTDYETWVDGYDVGIRYMDHHLGKLVELLKDLDVFEETLVVLSADHGEQLGELNVYGDHHAADKATCRVPLIIRGPSVETGVDDGLHYQLDLAPTLLELVGGEPPAGWDGRSFADSLTGGLDRGRETIVTSQGAWACQRGVRWDDWLLLRTYHNGFKECLDDVMLFDLAADPHETTNLAADSPGVVSEGLARLNQWVDNRLLEAARGENGGVPGAPDGIADPLFGVIHEGGPYHVRGRLTDHVAFLRETGRTEQAERLERQHG